MTTHDDYEIAIEQRRHGALDSEGVARLDEHLASCSACAAFADVSHHTEDEMRQQAAAATTRVDWSKIERYLASRSKQDRIKHVQLVGFAVMIFVIMGVFALRARSWHHAVAPLVVGCFFLLVLFTTAEILRRRSKRLATEVTTAARTKAGLLEFYRRQLDREIVAHRRAVPISIAICFLWTGPLLLGSPPLPTIVLDVGAAVALLVAVAWDRLVRLPRLRKERAALD
ncbi:hypothetical protein BH11MYX1_BH11MYX1_36210 [soil metagenome]